jgi:7-carboxy-7-deazaguanine synthase
MSIAEILQKVAESRMKTVVVTGGEPFLQAEFPELCDALMAAGLSVHLETSGTIFREVSADLVCVSPKLSGSAPDPLKFPELYAKHERARLSPETLSQFVRYFGKRLVFKFVVASKTDVHEVKALLNQLDFTDTAQVFLMPQSRTAEELRDLAPMVAGFCVESGFRYSDRLHVRLWGNTPGR